MRLERSSALLDTDRSRMRIWSVWRFIVEGNLRPSTRLFGHGELEAGIESDRVRRTRKRLDVNSRLYIIPIIGHYIEFLSDSRDTGLSSVCISPGTREPGRRLSS